MTSGRPGAPRGADHGVHLVRTEENRDEIAAFAERYGAAAGLGGLLAHDDGLTRTATPVRAAGRAPSYAFAWDPEDRDDERWWPQGITTSADAEDDEQVDGRRLLITSWYSKGVGDDNLGSRVTVVDLDTLRYRHVLLVQPGTGLLGARVDPLRIHAGGLVWWDHWLHVAGTRRGILTFNLDDLVRVPDELLDDTYGYRWVLPLRTAYDARATDGVERLRYSFLSLDRSASPPELVAGEYGRGGMTTRLVRFELDPGTFTVSGGEDGVSRPLGLDDAGVGHMQGACVVRGTWYVTASAGRWRLGSVHTGRPGAFRRHRWALPAGPEDITYWPSRDELWSLTEYPGKRVVFAMPRGRFA